MISPVLDQELNEEQREDIEGRRTLADFAQEAGIDYPDLIERIMSLAIRRSG